MSKECTTTTKKKMRERKKKNQSLAQFETAGSLLLYRACFLDLEIDEKTLKKSVCAVVGHVDVP